MGAWRDFITQQTSPTGNTFSGAPSVVQALKARPLRTLVFALGSVVGFSFFFAALGGPGNTHLKNAYSTLRSSTSKGSNVPAWSPSWVRVAQDNPNSKIAGITNQRQLIDNSFSINPDDGLEYPPDFFPSAQNPYKRANACLVSLVRNGEMHGMRMSMREVESAFNRKFGYPWVFLNDEPFSDEFKAGVRVMTRSEIYFGVIPKEHWGYPDWIDKDKAAEGRKKMEENNVIYGGSESYRHMCRFNSGFFFQHPLLQQFDYYWRVEPGVEFYCDVDYDPFVFMQRNNLTYSFTVAIYEYRATIESLWDRVKEFAQLYPQHIAPDNSLHFMVDDMSRGLQGSEYNLCHFWSNFEIADMRFWRSQAYQDFFNFLDRAGGFFYERWGDAPVHSIAAALFLPSNALHQFDDIAYRHNPSPSSTLRRQTLMLLFDIHCPQNREKYFESGKCTCDPKSSFDRDGYSCMRHWWRIGKEPDPVFS